MKFPDKKLERKLIKSGNNRIVGVDEVGMGALAGPVVVCAVMLDKSFFDNRHAELKNVRDSKLLSAKQRSEIDAKLRKTNGLKFKISVCGVIVIDRVNIRQASKKAMASAVRGLLGSEKIRGRGSIKLLVDGPSKIEGLDIEQTAIVGGDRKVFTIACASIIAKVYRDRLMQNHAKKLPGYGFEKHKGYGTKLHLARLAFAGPSPIHRRSFTPIAKLL